MSRSAPDTGADDGRLILFVTGDAPRSRRARDNLARALDGLGTTARPREIDLVEQPQACIRYGIFATPALLRVDDGGAPSVLYGDLSEEQRLRRFLADALGAPLQPPP